MLSPNNYFGGASRTTQRQCECCERPVIVNEQSPEIYGGGRFCSRKCSQLRTPEAHFQWMMDNPAEYDGWMEWRRGQETRPKKDPNSPGGDIVLPI